ncbi:MAG: arginyltransferase [Gammaproteobacteria bacterium]|nr:MAG: arginyltransferase [Gammaproteobacteria bacterium]
MSWPDLYITHPFTCPYYGDREARNIIPDPSAPMTAGLYDELIRHGFRRSGEHAYLPHCPNCSDCISLRVESRRFRPSRSDRRLLRAHEDTRVHITPPSADAETFALYRDYLAARHPGGGMDEPEADDFPGFLVSSWSRTEFVRFERDDRLLAVAVIDRVADGLSAVYTFFDPTAEKMAPGRLAILWMIEEAKRCDLPFVYLGYWIPGHPKMDYKHRFRPAQIHRHGLGWMELGED